jgi:ribonuclease HI
LDKEHVIIYTDGACDPNPGPGGWAAILRYGDQEKVLRGAASQTTNNRMELQAALTALRALKRSCHVQLHTDSEYLRQGITEWLATWQDRGWRTSSGQPVQNQDLWQALAEEVNRHKVNWHWVRGHAGDPLNERVDRLARTAIQHPIAGNADNKDPSLAGQVVDLYPRASCLGSPGPGGWAVTTRQGERIASISGKSPETTANALELTAALHGLRSLAGSRRVNVYTVSNYLYQGITRWVTGWEARGWTTKQGHPVRHKRLWQTLQEEVDRHEVAWHRLPADARPGESEQAAAVAAEAAKSAATEGIAGKGPD